MYSVMGEYAMKGNDKELGVDFGDDYMICEGILWLICCP